MSVTTIDGLPDVTIELFAVTRIGISRSSKSLAKLSYRKASLW